MKIKSKAALCFLINELEERLLMVERHMGYEKEGTTSHAHQAGKKEAYSDIKELLEECLEELAP